MISWGVDLGVRSFYAAVILDSGEHLVVSHVIKKPKDRYEELKELSSVFRQLTTTEEDSRVFVEEPVVAGVRNLRTSLKIAQNAGAVFAGSSNPATFVPVSSWKKEIVGKGNAKKEEIAEFLKANHYEMWANCNNDQNLIDATCVALYGVKQCQSNG